MRPQVVQVFTSGEPKKETPASKMLFIQQKSNQNSVKSLKSTPCLLIESTLAGLP